MTDHADTIRRYIGMAKELPSPLKSDALAALDALLAENQRLRDALSAIAGLSAPIGGGNTPAGTQCFYLKDVARAALADEESRDTPEDVEATGRAEACLRRTVRRPHRRC